MLSLEAKFLTFLCFFVKVFFGRRRSHHLMDASCSTFLDCNPSSCGKGNFAAPEHSAVGHTAFGHEAQDFGICLISWERQQESDPYKLFQGDIGVRKYFDALQIRLQWESYSRLRPVLARFVLST